MLQKFGNTFLIQDLCQVRGKLRRSLGHDGAARHVFEAQLDVAKANDVAALQLGVLDADAVDQDAVGAALIPNNPNVALAFQTARDSAKCSSGEA